MTLPLTIFTNKQTNMTTELLFCGNNINKPNMLELKTQILKAFSTGTDEIHILFDSKGGEVFYALDFYKFIVALPPDQKSKLHIYSNGLIQCSAALCFLSFDNRYVMDHSSFKVHRATLDTVSAVSSQKQKTIDSLNDQMLYIITKIISLTIIETDSLKIPNQSIDLTNLEAIQKGFGQQFNRKFQAGAIKIADISV
jgi:ATP-dependent protease ClpP protease subunit